MNVFRHLHAILRAEFQHELSSRPYPCPTRG